MPAKFGAGAREPASALLAREHAGLGRRVLLVRQLARRVQVGERRESCSDVDGRPAQRSLACCRRGASARPTSPRRDRACRRSIVGPAASGNSCSVCRRVSSIQVAPSATRMATKRKRVKSLTWPVSRRSSVDDREHRRTPTRGCGSAGAIEPRAVTARRPGPASHAAIEEQDPDDDHPAGTSRA